MRLSGEMCMMVDPIRSLEDWNQGKQGFKSNVSYKDTASSLFYRSGAPSSEGGLAELAHCGQSLRTLSTSTNQCYFESYRTHLEVCWIPHASIEAWGVKSKNPKKPSTRVRYVQRNQPLGRCCHGTARLAVTESLAPRRLMGVAINESRCLYYILRWLLIYILKRSRNTYHIGKREQ